MDEFAAFFRTSLGSKLGAIRIWSAASSACAMAGSISRTWHGYVARNGWPSATKLAQLQLETLNELVQLARETVPFYRERLPHAPLQSLDEMHRLPILTKADVRSAGTAMTSSALNGQRPLTIHTGGTTGTPLTIACDRSALQRNYAFFARFREWVGHRTRRARHDACGPSRTIVAPEQNRPPYWRRNRAANTLLCSSYHIGPSTAAAYVAALARFGPQLIDSYPSSIEPIAHYVYEQGITAIRPQAVITSSETLTSHTRWLIENAFGCPVFDHYGAAEMAAFITQCRAGAYHVNPEFGIVEILRDGVPVAPGEEGEIVATGFCNPIMPFIRYATGDLAVQGEGRCSCGRTFPIIEHIIGRLDDVLITPEGRMIGRLDPIFKAVSSLVETRIVQDEPDHVRVETVTLSDLRSVEHLTLLSELRNRLGPSMRIDIVRVASIPRTSSGKFRAVVNHLSRGSRDAAGPTVGASRF